MKATANEVRDAILFFAVKYRKEEGYKAIMKNTAIDKLISMIAYEMLLQRFCVSQLDQLGLKHYEIMREYVVELDEKGFVTFF